MTEPSRVIAEVTGYDGFTAALRAWIRRLGTSYESVGEIAGLQSGYLNTLLARTPIRSFSRMSLDATLGALALKIQLVVDEERLEQMRPRFAPRKNAVAGMPSRERPAKPAFSLLRGNPELARALHARWLLKSTRHQRRQIARRAALARWRNGGSPRGAANPVR
jgi:hypothetical protein